MVKITGGTVSCNRIASGQASAHSSRAGSNSAPLYRQSLAPCFRCQALTVPPGLSALYYEITATVGNNPRPW